MYSFLNPIAKPIAAILAAFYSVIPNFGVDILVLALIWMVIIAPLTLKSTRSMLAMQALQPEIKRLQEKHRNDRQAFAQAQMDLFRERGVSPWGSCLPTILPLPVFIALFQVIDGLSRTVKVHGVVTPSPRYLDHSSAMYKAIFSAHGHLNAFGLDLSKNPLSPHSSFAGALPYYLLLLIMIGTQYYQTSMMMNRNPAAAQNPQMKMMKYLPIVFGIILIRFPAGVILYYAMSNVCRISQQWAMYRYDPKVKSLVVQEVNEIEAKTREIERDDNARKDQSGKSLPAKKAPAKPAPAAGRPRLRDLLSPPGGSDQARPSNGTSGRDRAPRPTKGGAPAGTRSAGQGTMAPGAKSAKGSSGAARKAAGNPDGRTANGNGSNRVNPNGKGSETAKRSSGANPVAGGTGGNAAAAAAAGAVGARGTPKGSSGDGGSKADPVPATPGRPGTGTGSPGTASNGSSSNGSGGVQRASAGVPRTGAGAKRNIPPPRSGRSKKRRGR